MDDGTLQCEPPAIVTFTARGGTTYAVNGLAETATDDPDIDPVSDHEECRVLITVDLPRQQQAQGFRKSALLEGEPYWVLGDLRSWRVDEARSR